MEITCRVAESQEDLNKVINFRFDFLSVWNNFCVVKDTKQNTIADKFDKYAKYIICEKENNVIGVARLIPENPDGLFMDQFINSKNYISMPSDVNQNGKFIELSEFITHKDERRNSRIIYMLIIYSAWYILKSNQYNRAASISTRSVHELLKRLGFEKRPVEFLSEWGGVMTLHTLDFSKLNMNELERISKKLGIENFSI